MEFKIADLFRAINSGCDIRVACTRTGERRITVIRQMGLQNLDYRLPAARYEDVMNDLVSWLADQHASGVKTEIRMDFHGSQWVEMRAGILGLRKSKIGLSQRYITKLAQALQESILDIDPALGIVATKTAA